MSSKTTYAPGTLFRLYSDDNSKHYTAVLLKDGKVLEVKNPDTNTKVIFSSLSNWCASHEVSEDKVNVDTSKGSGVVINKITDGFNYPTERHYAYSWVQWLYTMVLEAAPHLLKSEEFRTLYNEMVDLCTEHKSELYHWYYYMLGKNRYSKYNLRTSYVNDKWKGYPGYFRYENVLKHNSAANRYTQEQYNYARSDIITVYTYIYNIVEPHISQYMNIKSNITITNSQISKYKASITRCNKKIKTSNELIDQYNKYIQIAKETLATYENELKSIKTV